ncbi:MAG TPA: hypothetical protein VK735_49535 [Pseudonocardia sp.]|uniref:hypothetical protein n=1 Tax=Pseudonocardia sp. TaxID=60912 RepID=UPI002BBAC278|nr:hypothetical protein [Pseudonocardia sp.]HTF55542.1 hypothetical protein [Pseudonocardia sp.]
MLNHPPAPTRHEIVSFEDWLVTQMAADNPRRKLVALMLDQRLNEVDFGARTVRQEFRRMLDDFESATHGLPVRSRPLPFRSPRTGRRPAADLPEEGKAG